MTRCSCPKKVCRPSTSFFYKVLSSLKQLQSNKKFCNGAGLEDISKFVDKTYNLTGDLLSQVENALGTAESYRFVVKKKNLYSLVSPAATLQFTPSPCVKAKLERIQEVFNSKWCEDGDTKRRLSRRPRSNSHSPLHFIPCIQTGQRNNIKKINTKKKSESKSTLRKPKGDKCVPNTSAANISALTPLTSSLAKYLKSSFKSCVCKPKGEVIHQSASALSAKETPSTLCTPSASKASSEKTTPTANSSRVSFKRTRSSSSTNGTSNKKKRDDTCSQKRSRGKRHRSRKSSRKKGRSNANNDSPNENMCGRNSSSNASNQKILVSNDDSDSDSSEC